MSKYVIVCLTTLLTIPQFSAAQQSPVRRIALTFDDLPYSSIVREGWLANAKRGTTQILAVLKAWGAF
jgi:peptidoglycan/xylan/chitin deacetylase (PgdA/CDA1 family)